jgi:hypothetical protein
LSPSCVATALATTLCGIVAVSAPAGLVEVGYYEGRERLERCGALIDP